jgi:hypothetical protein
MKIIRIEATSGRIATGRLSAHSRHRRAEETVTWCFALRVAAGRSG